MPLFCTLAKVKAPESDECGGLSVFLKEYTDAVVLCSTLCARELPGYGFNRRLMVRRESKPLEDVALKLRFFDYSSEARLQNGLL